MYRQQFSSLCDIFDLTSRSQKMPSRVRIALFPFSPPSVFALLAPGVCIYRMLVLAVASPGEAGKPGSPSLPFPDITAINAKRNEGKNAA